MSWRHMALLAMIIAGAALLIAAVPALAQQQTDIAKNVGDQVHAWGIALLLPVAVLVGLPALAKRDIGQAVQVTVVVILIGGFIYAAPTVTKVIQSLWTAFQGGG